MPQSVIAPLVRALTCLISPDFWVISLSEQLPVITSSMTITIQTSSGLLDLSGDFAYRIMKVTGASTNLTLRRVKLQAGFRPALADGGAAIRIINAHVTLDNTIFYNNRTLAPHGAASYLKGGTLDIQNSTFERNRGVNGAASVYGENSTITIRTTTFKDN